MTGAKRAARCIGRPLLDLWSGLERCLDGGFPSLLLVVVGLGTGWVLFVPIHELLHVLGCVATGGSVTRLEIEPLYGGALLEHVFPFVSSGSDYAGQLTGFDTHGSDLVYLATDLTPFLLTLFPGIWAFRRACRARRPFLFGFWIPVAFAPFTSLTGDAYEIGSILATRLPPWSAAGPRELVRGDDLFLVLGRVQDGAPWLGVVCAALLGLAWAYATYALGRWIAARLGEQRADCGTKT